MKRTARTTGVLYILVILCAGFAQGIVREPMFVSGDPGATLQNISSGEVLFRLGLVTDLLAFMADLAISVLLYMLLKDVSKTLALVSSAFRLIAHPAIGSLNLLNHYMAVELINSNDLFSPDFVEAGVTMLMIAHNYGYIIAGAFFGLHCLLLGILLYRSPHFPAVLGILMAAASIGYLMESFGVLLFPGNENWLAVIVGLTAAVGEVSLALYLVIKGVRFT